MNQKSLNLIREVIVNSGTLISVEISGDSIYLEFGDVELGTPKFGNTISLTVRFAESSFFTTFYNDIWDIEFLSKYNYKKQLLSQEVFLDVYDIKFLDFERVTRFFSDFKNQKTILSPEKFNIHNISCDFFMIVEFEKISLVIGANQMDFFTPYERLDDNSLMELANDWMLYFLNYHLKRNIIKDKMCENHPLVFKK